MRDTLYSVWAVSYLSQQDVNTILKENTLRKWSVSKLRWLYLLGKRLLQIVHNSSNCRVVQSPLTPALCSNINVLLFILFQMLKFPSLPRSEPAEVSFIVPVICVRQFSSRQCTLAELLQSTYQKNYQKQSNPFAPVETYAAVSRVDPDAKIHSLVHLYFYGQQNSYWSKLWSALLSFQQCRQYHMLRFFLSLNVPPVSLMLCTLRGGKWRFRLSRLSPDGGLWKALKCLQNVPWRMWNILLFLCCFFLFSFNLTISLSLSPDCIRIDCNLSKCLLWLFTLTWFREHAL